jgi:hypothetical protein
MRNHGPCAVTGCERSVAAVFEANGQSWPLCELHQLRMGNAVGRLAQRLLTTGNAGPWSGAETVIVEWTVSREPGTLQALRAARTDVADDTTGFGGETLYRGHVDAPTDYDLYLNIGAWDSQDDFYRAIPGAERGKVPERKDFELADRRRIWLADAPDREQ